MGAASNLVFDMHSEYGWKGSTEGGGEVKGLKQLFSSKVAVFSLDEESSKRRGLTPDYLVRIGYGEIEPEDVLILRETLGLSEVAADAAFALHRHYGGKSWLKDFLAVGGQENLRDLADELNVNQSALITLQNRLTRLERFDFMDESSGHDSVGQILQYLDRGMHVVLEFGRYGNNLAAYILIANLLLTRRIHQRYVQRMERASGDATEEPEAPRHHHRRGTQVPDSLCRQPDHLRRHRKGDAQIQCHPPGRRPAPQRHRRRGDEPARHQDNLPAGQR